MDSDLLPPLSDAQLRRLEKRIDDLIRTCQQLREENRTLKEREQHLLAERANLIEKTEQAYGRVEAMISRIKALEQEP